MGESQYTLCCAEDGGILDDLIVYRLPVEDGAPVEDGVPVWMVVPNAANTPTVVGRLREMGAGRDVTIEDESTTHAILAVQGPVALEAASVVLGQDLTRIPYLAVRRVEVPGGASAAVCRTGYTGEAGCEIVVTNDAAEPLWDALLSGGAVPVGLGARDTLRLEMGYPLHGNDIDPTTNPFEARLGWAVKLDHGDFVGRAVLSELKAAGTRRRLVGVRGSGRRPMRAGHDVLHDGAVVGSLTSGGFSPTLEVGIGLGYVDAAVPVGAEVAVDVRGREVQATVVTPPFVERSPKG
jgi:aminomethyltransferase